MRIRSPAWRAESIIALVVSYHGWDWNVVVSFIMIYSLVILALMGTFSSIDGLDCMTVNIRLIPASCKANGSRASKLSSKLISRPRIPSKEQIRNDFLHEGKTLKFVICVFLEFIHSRNS